MIIQRGNRKVEIDNSLIKEKFIHSGGPGGQNVNKVATAVQLRFDLGNCTCFSASEKDKIRIAAGSRLTQDQIIVIDSRVHRKREMNREAAVNRLREILLEGFKKKPRRIPTKPGKAAVARRLDSKKKDKLRKEMRKKISPGSKYE